MPQPRNKDGKFITEAERKMLEWEALGLLKPLPRIRVPANGRVKPPERPWPVHNQATGAVTQPAAVAASQTKWSVGWGKTCDGFAPTPPRRHADVDPEEAAKMAAVMQRIHTGIPPTDAEIDATLAKMAPAPPVSSEPAAAIHKAPSVSPAIHKPTGPTYTIQAGDKPVVVTLPSTETISLRQPPCPAPSNDLSFFIIALAAALLALFAAPSVVGTGTQVYLGKVLPWVSGMLGN